MCVFYYYYYYYTLTSTTVEKVQTIRRVKHTHILTKRQCKKVIYNWMFVFKYFYRVVIFSFLFFIFLFYGCHVIYDDNVSSGVHNLYALYRRPYRNVVSTRKTIESSAIGRETHGHGMLPIDTKPNSCYYYLTQYPCLQYVGLMYRFKNNNNNNNNTPTTAYVTGFSCEIYAFPGRNRIRDRM